MINFNLARFEDMFPSTSANWMWKAILVYVLIMLVFAIGNNIATRTLNPTYKDWGRILFGSLIWFCTIIVFSIIFYQPDVRLWAVGFTVVAWYFESKFLFDFSWIKGVAGWLIPIALFVLLIVFMTYVYPAGDFIKHALDMPIAL